MTGGAAAKADQGGVDRHRAPRTSILVLIGVLGATPTNAQTWRITPAITVGEIFTDNVELTPSDRKQSDFVTQVSPSLRVVGTGERLKVNLNYRLQQFLYAGDSDRNDRQNFLDGTATLEAVENWLFVEGTARITQQARSAFAPQPASDGTVNANRIETSAFSVSPYIQGRLGLLADYHLRYRFTTTSSRGSSIADTELNQLTGRVSGQARTALGWTVNANTQTVHQNVGDDTERTRLLGSLIYRIDPTMRGTVSGGQEWNNISGVSRSTGIVGARFDWAPTPRTDLSVYKEKRSLGDLHDISFNHRTRLTSWQFTDRKDIIFLPDQLLLPNRGVAYDLLFNQLTGSIADPVERGLAVDNMLQQNAIPSDLAQAAGFLTTRVITQRIQRASVALRGVRNTVTLTAAVLTNESVAGATAVADDLSLANEVKQKSVGGSWAHQLTPFTTANLIASHVRTSSVGVTGQDSSQTTMRLLFSHRIGPKTSATLGGRLQRFDNTASAGVREKAVIATLNVTF